MNIYVYLKLTKHGAVAHTHTPCLVIANMVDVGEVRIKKFVKPLIVTPLLWVL